MDKPAPRRRPAPGCAAALLVALTLALLSGSSSGASGAGRAAVFRRFRSQQAFFCSRIFPTVRDYPPTFMTTANVSAKFGIPQFPLYVYAEQDIVSFHIIREGFWESLQVKSTLELLEEYRVANNLRKEDITFLDIGSNIGVYAITIAMAGYKVIAFEPMQRNEMLVRSSICANNLMDRVTFINLGLSTKRQSCRIMSGTINAGDGIVLCDNQTVPPGYELRSTIQIDTLDTVIPPNMAKGLHVPVFKMDTEGMESQVMLGGRHFFSKPELRHGFLEFNTGDAGSDRTVVLAEELQRQGYKVSLERMNGAEYDAKAEALNKPFVKDAFAWRP